MTRVRLLILIVLLVIVSAFAIDARIPKKQQSTKAAEKQSVTLLAPAINDEKIQVSLAENERIVGNGGLLLAFTAKSPSGKEKVHSRVIINNDIKQDSDRATYYFTEEGVLIAKQYFRDDGAFVTEVDVR